MVGVIWHPFYGCDGSPFPSTQARFVGDVAYVGKEVMALAKTEEGKKFVPVKPYVREVNGKPVPVRRHDRSTPNKGK